ncbi:MAG: LysR family transcriptional regulator, partial [Pseudomonadota bacterium]
TGVMAVHDWEQIPYFLAVARHGSLRTAAEALNATHGTVKRHVEALEATYGVQLFRRTRRGLFLTAAGQSLMPIAEQAELLMVNGRNRLSGLDREESGTIRFSLTGTIAYEIAAPILMRFFEAYPAIDIQLRVTDRLESINKLETDVSLRYTDQINEDVVARRLLGMNLSTYASKSYIEKHLPHAGPGGEGLHWIGWDEINHTPDWVRDTDFPAATVRHATTDPVMQLALARSGVGMVRTSVYFGTLFPELMEVPGASVYRGASLWMLLHSELRNTVRVRRFVDFFSKELLAIESLL